KWAWQTGNDLENTRPYAGGQRKSGDAGQQWNRPPVCCQCQTPRRKVDANPVATLSVFPFDRMRCTEPFSTGESPVSTSTKEILSTLFGHWTAVAEETILCLGEETADLFGFLGNDAIEIHGAIADAYAQGELLQSLVYLYLTGLFKEFYWLNALFLFGNYPMVLSRLRFNWEASFRAHHADTYALDNPDAPDGPGPTLDEKHEWLMQREERLRWN